MAIDESSKNEIRDLGEDWGRDERNGLPYSGESIQKFIKKTIRSLMVDVGDKFGDVQYEGGALRFYSESGGTQLGAVTITGTSYTVNVKTNVSSNITVLTTDETFPITIEATTKSMEFGSAVQEDFPEDYFYKVEIDTGSGYVDRTPENNTIKEGGQASVDIRRYVVTGNNRIRLVVTGAISGQPRTLTFNANLTSLALSCKHQWNKAWIQGEQFQITNIYFTGNIVKTLYVKVGEEVHSITYPASTQYGSVPTTFDLTDKTPSESCVIPIEMWMAGEDVETKHIFFNLMYVAKEDIGKISLICTNNVKDKVYNFAEETLLEYATYNLNSINAQVVANYDGNSVELINTTQAVVAQTVYELKLSLQIDTMLSEGISLDVTLQNDGAIAEKTISVDNSYAYLPTDGYLFYLNPSLGNNNSSAREQINNSAPLSNEYKATYTAKWNNFTFADDAWSEDSDGNRALVIKAGSSLEIEDLKPLRYSNNNSASFEFMYRASNIADYDTPIMTCIDTETYDPAKSVGFVVFPTRILLLGDNKRLELFQQLPLSEDRIHHITVVIQREYASAALNLARIYINGCENVTFDFGGDNHFYNASAYNNLHMGQESTDYYFYMTRIYNKALAPNEVFANYLNAMIDTVSANRKGLRDDNNIVDGNSISYDLCKKAGFNLFTIETDLPLPSLSNQVSYSSGVNYHLEYNDHPEWNVSIFDAPCDGQGTTSSLYEKWNLRSKIKKALRWLYHNIKDANGNPIEEVSKEGYLFGYKQTPAISTITWKKNVASQPQGHKMGATAFYNDIFKRVMGGGEKLVEDKILPTADTRVATEQKPFLAFQKYSDGHYEFRGLMTGGADKKDKKTFGYNATDEYPSLMMIEGPNHDPFMTRFLVPWTDDVFYDYLNETLSVGATSATEGAKQEGWDADIVAGYSTDKAEDAKAIYDLYVSEFKPAYDAVYYNSPYIAHIDASGYTLEQINNNLTTFWQGKTGIHANSLMTFYNDNYELVYYRVKTGKYEVLPLSFYNMLEDLGLSSGATTAEIFNARAARWKPAVGAFVSLREAYFRQDFDEFIGASDNDAKNSYWRKFLALVLGGKWGFNEDDLDTIFQNDNNGQDTKTYYVEPNDTNADGADIFQGRTSAFWYGLRLHCKDELKGMMHEIMEACSAEAEDKNLKASTLHETLLNLLSYYFWEHSSKYFPATAYNADTQYAYIDVWFKAPDAVYNNVPPLTQIHGDHYETEREWVEKRIAYIFSKYQIGAFEAGSADGYGSLEITPAESFEMEITPAIWLYPRISVGGSETEASERTEAGDVCRMTLPASGTTGVYVKGLNWLSDLGDLSGFKLATRGGSTIVTFSIDAKRLRRLKLGDVDGGVVFNANTLGVKGDAIELIDARNVTTAAGELDLQKCPRLKEVYLGGTALSSVFLPIGGRVRHIQYPDTISTIVLHSLNLLQDGDIELSDAAIANIKTIYFNSCEKIDPMALLNKIYSAEGSKLSTIGLSWKGVIRTDAKYLSMIGDIAAKAGIDGGYNGVDFDGGIKTTPNPNISGTIDVADNYVYQEDIDAITAKLTNLKVLYNPNNLYVKFADPEVQRICAENWGDGMGITTEQIEAVTDIGTKFKGNTTIEYFDELNEFTGISRLGTQSNGNNGAFSGCVNLKSVIIPKRVTLLNYAAFNSCSKLENINLEYITTIGEECFANCTSLSHVDISNSEIINNKAFYNCTSLEIEDLSLPNLETLGQNAFYGVKIKKISNLGKITALPTASEGTQNFGDKSILEEAVISGEVTSIPNNSFNGYAALTSIKFPNKITLGEYAFRGCTALSDVDWTKITKVGYGAFLNCISLPSEITIPNMTQGIGRIAFSGCTSIIKFSASATSIDNAAFDNCKIEEVTLLNAVSLGASAFNRNYQLKVVRLRDVTTFTGDVFFACENLETVIVDNITPPSLSSNAFQSASSTFIIYVPDASVEAYKTASNWSNYADRIYPISVYNEGGVSNIIEFADPVVEALCLANFDYNGNGYISKAEAASVTDIGSKFANNTDISSFDEFEDFINVTYIDGAKSNSDYRGFINCTALKRLTLPKGLKINNGSYVNIVGGAFVGSSVEYVGNLDKVSYIGKYAFYNVTTLLWDGVYKHTELKEIAIQAFFGCTNFKAELVLPALTTLGNYAFCNSGVKRVLDLGFVTTIHGGFPAGGPFGDFYKCLNLELVILPSTLTTINNYAFAQSAKLSNIIIKATVPPTLTSTGAFSGIDSNFKVYVPDTSVAAYQAETTWSNYASRIKGISSLQTDNPTLYEEIKEYLN